MVQEDWLYEGKFSMYPSNHVWFPCLIVLIYLSSKKENQKQTAWNYWSASLFSFSALSLFELLELLAKKLFSSYIIFGTDNGGSESLENIIILDLGNGLIGIVLCIIFLYAMPPRIKKTTFIRKWVLLLIYGIIFSYLSSKSHCGLDPGCNPPYSFPYGIPLCILLTYLYGYVSLRKFVNKKVVYGMMFNATVLILGISFRWQSTAITTYISSGVLICVWSSVWLIRYNYTVEQNIDREDSNDKIMAIKSWNDTSLRW